MGKKKINRFKTFLLVTIPFIVTLFFIALFSAIWGFIAIHKWKILIITGILIIIYALFGVFKPKKFMRSLRRRL